MSNLDCQIALASQSIAQIRHKTKGPIDHSSLIPPYHEEGSLRYHDGDYGEISSPFVHVYPKSGRPVGVVQ